MEASYFQYVTEDNKGVTLGHTDLFQDQSEWIEHKSTSICALQQNSRDVKQHYITKEYC